MKGIIGLVSVTLGAAIFGGFFHVASADRFSSTNYVIDASVMNSTGGLGTSTSYKLVSSAGESIVGNGASGSYKMGAGYVAQLQQSQGVQSLSFAVQPSGLVAYYPFDENAGTTVGDNSSYAANGSFVGTPTWSTGKVGAALTFNGSSQAVAVGTNTQTQLTNGTVEAWVSSNVSTGTMAIAHKQNAYYLQLNTGKLALYDWTGAATCSAASSITDGAWHHVAMTLQSGVANGSTLYVDGTAVKTCTWTPVSQTAALTLGAAYTSSYGSYLNGSLDQVKLYSRVLSAGEIAAEYSAGAAGVLAGVALDGITPGVPSTTGVDVVVKTTGVPNYTLALNQNHDLQNGANVISPISGTIASPSAWVDGMTKGFGFTLVSAPALDGKWASGANYAAAPGTATTYYARTGATDAVKDVVGMRLKADATSGLPYGQYTNQLTVTGTITP